MHFAVAHGETIEFQRKELLDLLRPRFVDSDLRILFARRVYEIHFRVKEVDIANKSAIEKRAPLHRKINQGRGKKWDRHVASRFYDLDMMDLISTTPKMHRHGRDMTTIFRHFGQFPIYIVANPKRQQGADDNEKNE